MLTILSKNDNISILFIIIILNYILNLFFNYDVFLKTCFLCYILYVLYCLFFINKNNYLLIFIILLFVLSLGTPTVSWDARSIWLFKAKQIFFEKSIFNFDYKYAFFSNFNYPNIVPTFNSSYVTLIGFWNEVYPKSGNILFLIPTLFYFEKEFKNNYFLIFLLIILFVLGRLLIDGTMDGILSLYFVTTTYIYYTLLYNKYKNNVIILLVVISIIFTLLKLEAVILLLSVFISYFVISFHNKKINYNFIFIILITFIPILSWHLNLFFFSDNIKTSQSVFSITAIYYNIKILDNYLLISKYILLNEKLLLSFLIFCLSSIKLKSIFSSENFFIFLIFFIYLIFLFIAYLTTNLDLQWHLDSSATRVIKPLILLLLIFSLKNLKKINE